MAKLQKCSYLSLEALNQLVNDPSSLVELIRSPCNIALQPYHCKQDINESIAKILHKDIGKHFHLCKGILLGFQNVMVCSQYGVLFGASPTTYQCIQAEFFVFKATIAVTIGKVLKGIVNGVDGKDVGHVECLVHQTFKVSIPKPVDNDTWIGDCVWKGAEISVEIIEIRFRGRMPYFKGALRNILSEPADGFRDANNGAVPRSKKQTIIGSGSEQKL